MRPCYHIEIETPKKIFLNGLWFGPVKPKQVIIWLHGLGSSAFSRLEIVDKLVDENTAVLTFNNRGHDKVATGYRGKKRIKHGAAHEVFTECVDDIRGAIAYAKSKGAKSVYLAGHSTGCQKASYWSAKDGKGVKGLLLLAPISDYSSELHLAGPVAVRKGMAAARRLITAGKKHELLNERDWKWMAIDAQRFVSLYGGKGPEEIFTYWDPKKTPKTLRSLKQPTLVLIAENDEFADRPASEIATWFKKELRVPRHVSIVPMVEHSFKGAEREVAQMIKDFVVRTTK